MPLLLIPLLLVLLCVLVALAYPIGLVQRYRAGKARRFARGWLLKLNAWLLVVSVLLFLAGAWIGGHWIAQALPFAACGLLAGAVLGILGIWITRFEHHADGAYYTPNRWLVLALTLLLVARIALGVWQAWHRAPDDAASPLSAFLADHANVFAIGGVLFGYYFAYAWALLARMSRLAARRL